MNGLTRGRPYSANGKRFWRWLWNAVKTLCYILFVRKKDVQLPAQALSLSPDLDQRLNLTEIASRPGLYERYLCGHAHLVDMSPGVWC